MCIADDVEGSNDDDNDTDEIVLIDESNYGEILPMMNHRLCEGDLVVTIVEQRIFCDLCNKFVPDEEIERWADAE